jgi:hypothetical protein
LFPGNLNQCANNPANVLAVTWTFWAAFGTSDSPSFSFENKELGLSTKKTSTSLRNRDHVNWRSVPIVFLEPLPIQLPGESPMVTRAQALKVNAVLVKSKATPDDILKAVEEAIVRMPG